MLTVALVTTIIKMITNLRVGNAFVVGTFELQWRAGGRPFSAQRVAVLITSIATVINLITDLPEWYTLAILALELSGCIALEISTLVF